MAKRKTTRRKSAKSRRPAGPGPIRRWWGGLTAQQRHGLVFGCARVVVLTLLAGAAGVGLYAMRGFVMAQPPYADNMAVVELDPKPEWMTDELAAEICAELRHAAAGDYQTFTPDLARRVHDAAQRHPWIRKVNEVRIERAPADVGDTDFSRGRVVVDAEFGRPEVVVVGWGREFYLDGYRVVLPYNQARRQVGSRHLVRIVGVQRPAPAAGAVWEGDDLIAGMRVARLLADRVYYREIIQVDVTHHQQSRSRSLSGIRLVAMTGDYATDIYFGDLPTGDLPPIGVPSLQRRLGYLDGWYRFNASRLAGPAYLDLRLPDQINYPTSYVPAYQ